MHLVSPALPVGAYAYSQGLELAIDRGWLRTEADIAAWLEGILSHGLGYLDLPVLARLHRAWRAGDAGALLRWSQFVRAARETHELLLEDEQLGMALNRLLNSLDVVGSQVTLPPCFATQFARACHHWNIAEAESLLGFAFSWLENQVAAATKLVPLGQTQAQKLLVQLMTHIEAACAHACTLEDAELGLSLPGLALASAQHERQYSRLFRS